MDALPETAETAESSQIMNTTPITVKPLEWRLIVDEMTLGLWETKTGWNGPLFEIIRYCDDSRFHLSKCRTGAPSTPYPTLQAAQAAAQKEWESFILSAIESP